MTNPYQPPVEPMSAATSDADLSLATQPDQRSAGPDADPGTLSGWLCLVAVNLPLCLMFSGFFVDELIDWFGVILPIIVLAASGWLLYQRSPWLARRLRIGGSVVAAMQMFPIIHIVVGGVMVDLVGLRFPFDDAELDAGMTALPVHLLKLFASTTLVALALMAISIAIGVCLAAVSDLRQSNIAKRDEPEGTPTVTNPLVAE